MTIDTSGVASVGRILTLNVAGRGGAVATGPPPTVAKTMLSGRIVLPAASLTSDPIRRV